MSRPREAGAPINLSLSEDERSPNRSSAELQSPKLGKSHPAVGQHAASSPTEEADPLYEYFPLSVDDWYVCSYLLCQRVFVDKIAGCHQ